MEPAEANSWKQRIKELAYQSGFSAIGFTSGAHLEGLKEYLEERIGLGYQLSFEDKNLQKRVDPKAIWPLCETVVALAYPLPLSVKPREGEGVLARSAVGEDYHRLVRKALDSLISSITTAGWPGQGPLIQVDTGPLNERAFANRAGLGWIGKNQQLIIPGVGSFVVLALIFLDQVLPSDEPMESRCGECTRCVQVCPAQILGQPRFQASRCISYLTQSKECLSESQQSSIGNRIFGCDTCQEACPHNRNRLDMEEELENAGGGMVDSRGVDLWDTQHLTKSQFMRQWKNSAAGWRGKGILQRNAHLALQNLNMIKR
ncbi:MAG: tRNA epoxyqueuosine(34) reductase QueG [Desulfitobacterium sp.]